MSQQPSALRKDLVRSAQGQDEADICVIKDPASRQYYRLRGIEVFIADQLDGDTALDTICSRVELQFGQCVSQYEVADFVATLDRNGLLDNGRSRATRPTRRRVHGGLFDLRIKLVDPDRLLNALAPRLERLFTPQFVWMSAVLICMATGIGILNWHDLTADTSRLIDVSTIPLLIATIFITISLHELAHATTCKHFGGEVPELGLMFLYLQPALYCNVSDAWLFADKSKRMWVTFAGPYFEFLVWALAIVAWRVTDTDTLINRFALITIATSGVKTLINFNPLIKLDGYYLLSDYLNVPNLRQKSFDYVGNSLKRIFGRGDRGRQVSKREHSIYLSYGVTAWLFSVSLITYIGLMFGEYLVVEGQRVAFFALSSVVGLRLRSKFRSLFGQRPTRTRSSRPVQRTSSVKKRSWFRPMLKYSAALALLALIIAGRLELKVAGPIDVLPLHNADVRAEIEGTIQEILVEEGQFVHKGDLIARLSDRDLHADLLRTEAQIRQVQARLDELVAGPTDAVIEVSKAAVVAAEDRLAFATAKRARAEELANRHLVSSQEFDLTREAETAARNELAEASGKLQVLLRGTRPEQVQAAQAELEQLEAQLRFVQGQLQRVEVRSPAQGIVTTPSRQLHAMLRQVIPKGGLIAKIYELETVTVDVFVSEKDIADVRIGQKVLIKTRAYPGQLFHGQVTTIATTTQDSAASTTGASVGAGTPGTSDGSVSTIRVTTEIDNAKHLLKSGMTGMAKVYCGERRVFELIARRLSRTFRVEFWSWW